MTSTHDPSPTTHHSPTVQSKLIAFLREPLVHFLVIGASFFLLWHFVGERLTARPQHVVITPGQIQRLGQQWTRTHPGRPLTYQELVGLIDQEIDEEILYREAVAMGLDRDDAVIRRRLAVKMDFLTDDAAASLNPSDEQLQSFLDQHPEKFSTETLTTFTQVYIDRSKHADRASAEAQRLLTLLNGQAKVDWKTLGDPLPRPSELQSASEAEVAGLFGREFPKKLAMLPVGRWSGPVESTYGLHLVLVRERAAGGLPRLDEVRDTVTADWRAAQRKELNAILRQQRRGRYAVTIQWPDWAKAAGDLSPETVVSGGTQ